MNEFQTTLYADLMALVTNFDDFSFRDFVQADGTILRIFNYRLGSYSAFMQPNALNCRGTMFHVAPDGSPIALVALPMEKFFTNEENPMTQKLDFSAENIIYAANKLDGSLISTYIDPITGELKLKSKNSTISKEVAAATALLNSPEYVALHGVLTLMTQDGYTVDLEYTSPSNRIVLEYTEDKLSILSMRNRENGCSGLPYDFYGADFYQSDFHKVVAPFMAKLFSPEETAKIIAEMDTYDAFEGLVVCLRNPKRGVMRVKLKSLRYKNLHLAVDAVSFTEGITQIHRLFNCVVYEQADDFKSIFASKPEYNLPMIFQAIEEIEAEVVPKFNGMLSCVENFFAENKTLDRKAYAQKAQAIKDGFFELKMGLYMGRENDYQRFAVKNMGLFYKAKPANEPAAAPVMEAEAA